MTFKQLDLTRFQPHKRKRVKLHPRVTVIVGETGTGKSAIIRGLRLVCLNQPRGASYVKHGSKSLSVGLAVRGTGGKGFRVQIGRGKGKNAYHLDGKRFAPEKRRSVPQAIERLLNVSPASFQDQDEPHFWLYDSPGQVAKHLNELADLETMDRVMTNLATEGRQASSEVTFTKARHKEAKSKLRDLGWIPKLAARLERLARLESRIATNRATIARIERLAEKASQLQTARDKLSGAIVDAKTAVRHGRKAAEVRQRVEKLSELARRLREGQAAKLPDFKPAFAARDKADRYAEKRRRLESIVKEIKEKEERCEALERELTSTRKNRPSAGSTRRCPTCGQKLSSSR